MSVLDTHAISCWRDRATAQAKGMQVTQRMITQRTHAKQVTSSGRTPQRALNSMEKQGTTAKSIAIMTLKGEEGDETRHENAKPTDLNDHQNDAEHREHDLVPHV